MNEKYAIEDCQWKRVSVSNHTVHRLFYCVIISIFFSFVVPQVSRNSYCIPNIFQGSLVHVFMCTNQVHRKAINYVLYSFLLRGWVKWQNKRYLSWRSRNIPRIKTDRIGCKPDLTCFDDVGKSLSAMLLKFAVAGCNLSCSYYYYSHHELQIIL